MPNTGWSRVSCHPQVHVAAQRMVQSESRMMSGGNDEGVGEIGGNDEGAGSVHMSHFKFAREAEGHLVCW